MNCPVRCSLVTGHGAGEQLGPSGDAGWQGADSKARLGLELEYGRMFGGERIAFGSVEAPKRMEARPIRRIRA